MDEMFDDWESDTPLDVFRDDGWITEALQEVKSGKEATVYCCRAVPSLGMDLVAAKVYRSRQVRNFRNDAVYREGRMIRDKRLRRAAAKGTAAGQAVRFSGWIEHEFTTQCLLHAAGADVPRPLACAAGGALLEYVGEPVPRRRRALSMPIDAILMDYVGDDEEPAPHLNSVALDPDEARLLFDRLIRNVELWLAHNVVHGDLSAFNILYWEGNVTVIDFPQTVDPAINSSAPDLLARDIANVWRYFARYGVRGDPARIAAWMWRRYMRGELASG